jgi:hypothetical protein
MMPDVVSKHSNMKTYVGFGENLVAFAANDPHSASYLYIYCCQAVSPLGMEYPCITHGVNFALISLHYAMVFAVLMV